MIQHQCLKEGLILNTPWWKPLVLPLACSLWSLLVPCGSWRFHCFSNTLWDGGPNYHCSEFLLSELNIKGKNCFLPQIKAPSIGLWNASGSETSAVAVLGQGWSMVVTRGSRSSVLGKQQRIPLPTFYVFFSSICLTRESYAFCLTSTEICILIG